MNYKQIYAIKKANENRILKLNPKMPTTSGIYIFTRFENGFNFAYVGQATNLLERTASHLNGFNQHIDLSLKKHGLFSDENLNGWDVNYITCEYKQLEDMEDEYIKKYANMGFQMLNKTSGRQGKGKKSIVDTERKGYNQGLANGYKKAQKEIAKLFEKNLKAEMQGSSNKLKERAMSKFNLFLKID